MVDGKDIAEFLQEMQLFDGLNDQEIANIANRLETFKLKKGQLLFAQGDYGENFYIIKNGLVRVSRLEKQEELELALLEAGDSFGEEELLVYRPRIASITAVEDTTLLYLDNHDFEWILASFPAVKPNLDAIAESHQRARDMEFEWLGEGEVIHLISQRHIAHLLFNLLRPFVILLPGLLVLFFIYLAPTLATQLLASIFSGLFLIAAVLWTVWYIIDWRNDYFIVTNQRVVWLEQVLLQSASRNEAPMSAIQSVNITTSLLGRIFDYGSLIVRTYTGSLVMTNVSNPLRMKGHIEELILRARKKSHNTKLDSIRYSIRKSLGYSLEAEESPQEPAPPPPVPEEQRLGFGMFKTREVDGDTFTYHKHWFSLLRPMWIPLIITFSIVGVMAGLLWRNAGSAAYPPPNTIFLLGSFAITAPILTLIYQYLDWRNDLYRVSKDAIIDSEKKPFSTEITKSAPLKNVLSLNHEKRGILGIMLNFGEVNINVGDTMLTFRGVPNPAQVQQDIFYRMEKLKRQEESDRQEEDHNRMTEWIKTYHELRETEENSA